MYARLSLLAAVIVVIPIVAIMALSASRSAGANNESEDHEPIHLVRHGGSTTSCGVERWNIKTGMDPGAKRVNLTPISTNIIHLRSVPAPAQLPATSRVRPTEL